MNYTKEDSASIQAMFNAIAKRYDRANAVLSLNLHRYWNRQLVRCIAQNSPKNLLDLCCGTGDIAFTFLKQSKQGGRVYLLDFSADMLACAQQKARTLPQHIQQSFALHYLQADAQSIPLPNDNNDAITIAYGIRNIHRMHECFAECWRVLQPGGILAILELTRPTHKLLQLGHRLYLKTCLPLLGHWVTSEKAAYEYLCRSIHEFSRPEHVLAELQKSGFCTVQQRPLTGGIATLFTAQKPL